MPKTKDTLSLTFHALADPTRRRILARLASGELSVTQLAEPFEMTMPAVSKHLKVLERAGLIVRSREAQYRPAKLQAAPLKEAADWVEQYRKNWEESFDRLDAYLKTIQNEEEKKEIAMAQLEERLIEVSRTFDAPLELLWKAWTEPEHFMAWYGPKGFTAPTCEIDLRVGGRHLWSMLSPDGKQMFFTGTYKEVSPMERLVFTDTMSDAEGNVMGMGEGMPESMDVTVTFVHANGKTTVTVSHVGYGPGAEYAGMGWEQAFDKLTAVLAKG